MQDKRIIPTVGRKVYFFQDDQQQEPCDATIIKVWAAPDQAQPETVVNLLVINPITGEGTMQHSIGASEVPVASAHYRWMPYQVSKSAEEKAKPQGSTTAKYFAFAHLPPHLQLVSKPLGQLADLLEQLLPNGPEKSAGMRKLLEAKDCFVRSALDIQAAELLAKAPITDSDRFEAILDFAIGNFDNLKDEEFTCATGIGPNTRIETQADLIKVVDALIAYQRTPQQHTEDVDHFEG